MELDPQTYVTILENRLAALTVQNAQLEAALTTALEPAVESPAAELEEVYDLDKLHGGLDLPEGLELEHVEGAG